MDSKDFSKAQISAEFFVFIGIAFLMAIAFQLASLDQINDFRLKNENDAVKDAALKIQKELLIAANVEDGYSRAFTMPDKINQIDYSLTTQNSTVAVTSKNSIYEVSIPNSVGILVKGTNRINKTGGVIYIT